MTQPEPIEELHKFLTDRKQLSEKIGEVQGSLSQVKKKISESLLQQYVTTTTEKVTIKEDLMRDEQSYERLLQALRDMHKEIEERIRPVEEQIVQAEVDYLKGQFERQQNALADCLGRLSRLPEQCSLLERCLPGVRHERGGPMPTVPSSHRARLLAELREALTRLLTTLAPAQRPVVLEKLNRLPKSR